MTVKTLFKPLLVAAIVLNVVSAVWLSRLDAEEPTTAPPRPPARFAGCPAP